MSHVDDPTVRSNLVIQNWAAYGLDAFGPMVIVEDLSGPPYRGSHQLMTDLEPAGPGPDPNYHGATIIDFETPLGADGVTPIFKPVWEFMLAAPPVLPRPELSVEEGEIQLQFETREGIIYQIQESGDFLTWREVAEPVLGSGMPVSTSLPVGALPAFQRIQMTY